MPQYPQDFPIDFGEEDQQPIQPQQPPETPEPPPAASDESLPPPPPPPPPEPGEEPPLPRPGVEVEWPNVPAPPQSPPAAYMDPASIQYEMYQLARQASGAQRNLMPPTHVNPTDDLHRQHEELLALRQTPLGLFRIFVARVWGVTTLMGGAVVIKFQEQCLVAGTYVDFIGGRVSGSYTDNTTGIPLFPISPWDRMPVVNERVLVLEELDQDGNAYRYYFIHVGSPASIMLKLDSALTGSGKYASFLVTGQLSSFNSTTDEVMPEGLTVSSTLVYYINTDESSYVGTHCLSLNPNAFVHGTLRGFSEGGVPLIFGESVNENTKVSDMVDLDDASPGYDPTALNWNREVAGSSPNFGGVPFYFNPITRPVAQDAGAGLDAIATPPTGAVTIQGMSRLVTVGACGRFLSVSAEDAIPVLTLPNFDTVTAASDLTEVPGYSFVIYKYDAGAGRWVKKNVYVDQAIKCLSITCNDDGTVTATPSYINVLATIAATDCTPA